MEERYCHECGSPLTQDATFCPSCGADINSSTSPSSTINPSATNPTPHTTATVQGTNNRRTITILCLLWGIGAAILGLCIFFASESITDEMINKMSSQIYTDNKTYWEYLLENGMDRNLFVNAFEIHGIVLSLSALMALISAHFIYREEHYTIALVTLILSSLLATCLIFSLIVGIVVTYKLTKHKNEFIS